MKFSRKELHVEPSKVCSSKKRKRSSSHEVATKKVGVEVMEERMEPTPCKPYPYCSMLASLFSIIKTNLEAKMEVSV